MVIALTGENGFGLGLALRQLVDSFVAEHGDLALERIDAEEAGFARLQESLTSLPFLASKKACACPLLNGRFFTKFAHPCIVERL